MWPDWVSNPGPLTYKSGALPTALHGLADLNKMILYTESNDRVRTDLEKSSKMTLVLANSWNSKEQFVLEF